MTYKRRKSYRFEATPGTLASVSFNMESFEVETKGLVYNESFLGCACVFIKNDNLVKGKRCLIQCGDLNPTGATIRWMTYLDPDVLKAGFEYDED